MKMFLILTFLCLAIPAFALETVTFRVTNVTTNRTLIADFDAVAGSPTVRYRHFQLLNPTAAALECARAPIGDSILHVPAGFTSLTLDDAKPTGQLYCAFAATTGEVVVNVWGVP